MNILVIEDERELRRSIVDYLHRQNYHCETADSFSKGRRMMDDLEYDCILLDISLGDGNGLNLLKELQTNRKSEAVIIISANSSLDDKVAGLNMGADDYLAKPFHLSELSARIAAVIRRKKFDGNNQIIVNDLIIDIGAQTISVGKNSVDLTRKEYDLLLFLVSNRNRVISKTAIAEKISGEGAYVYDNFDFIYAHMKNLKRKLAQAGCPEYIKSIYGMGYKFSD